MHVKVETWNTKRMTGEWGNIEMTSSKGKMFLTSFVKNHHNKLLRDLPLLTTFHSFYPSLWCFWLVRFSWDDWKYSIYHFFHESWKRKYGKQIWLKPRTQRYRHHCFRIVLVITESFNSIQTNENRYDTSSYETAEMRIRFHVRTPRLNCYRMKSSVKFCEQKEEHPVGWKCQ